VTAAEVNVLDQLTKSGYRGLLPVAPPGAPMSPHSKVDPGKVPSERGPNGWRGVEKWTERSYPLDELRKQFEEYGAGFGFATTSHPCIDSDVTDPALSEVIERGLSGLLHFPLKRVGRPPKFVIPCRWANDTRFGKIKLHLHDAVGQDRGVVEILGERCFVVLAGVHPKTGSPYRWYGSETEGGVELLAGTPIETLPAISDDIVSSRILPALTEALGPLGVTVSLTGRRARTTVAVDQETLLAPSLEDLAAVVAAIPNEADYEGFVKMARAIRAAAGEDHLAEGFALLEQWAVEGKDGLGGSRPPSAVWETLDPPHEIGWEYILQEARNYGVNTAVYAFEADPTAAPPIPRASVQPLPTVGERIAGLLGDAMPSLFLEVPTLRGEELRRRWVTLEAATRAADPLRSFFLATVLPLADQYRGRSRGLSRLLLESKLRPSDGWQRLPLSDQEILITAAWAATTPPSSLMSQPDALVAPVDIFGPRKARAWVVERYVPEASVGVVFGAPKARKTFVVADLAGRIAAGLSFRGRAVERGGALYFASECQDEIADRFRSWVAQNEGGSENFKLIPIAFPLLDPGRALREVAQRQNLTADPLRLVVVDVLRSSITDENSNEVMAAAVATAQLIARAFNVAVVLVHHSPRADATRTSGGNALDGGVDWGWGVEKKKEKSTVTVRMSRGGDESDAWSVRVESGVLQVLDSDEAEWVDVYSESEVANEAGRAGHRLGKGATRDAIKSLVREARPAWFSSPVPSGTAKNRANLALVNAEKAGYVVQVGDRFSPGPVTPPPGVPGMLEALLEPAARAAAGVAP
jgi:AAA domain